MTDVDAVLALDQGTTSSRAMVVDRAGNILALAQKEVTQYYPQPGWVEHDAQEIWASQYACAQEALRTSGIAPARVAAIGITNQRETTLLWDRQTGRPLSHAIVWQDRRTAAQCDELRAAGLNDVVAKRTGLLLDPYFSATKIAWLLDSIDGARTRADRGELAFGTIDAWLIWNLTGGTAHVTDLTNASRTMLYDIERRQWCEELLTAFRIPRSVLPVVLPCTAEFGLTRSELFGAPIRICGVAGDQHAALFGQGAVEAGLAKSTYGTGCFVMLNTGSRIVPQAGGLIRTIGFALGDGTVRYALEGSIFNAGAAIQWLRDGLQIIGQAGEVEPLAGSVPDSEGVYFVPAFTGLGAPYWDPHARGTIVGITRGTGRAHIARAALEAVAYQAADVVNAMEDAYGAPVCELRVDGGGSQNALLMQLQADLLGLPVVRPGEIETTALGAAYLAGLQSGFWRDVGALESLRQEDVRFEPAMPAAQRRARMERWHDAVDRSRNWTR
ncbi:MAG TPA: glycerol kinase GlpK [Candidatus Baltobacteraceae bacterium]|nr:glycerol kinase GlpK [Candidatus Baltobacteraceae bacterium]